jgi:hypothetical protein
MAITSSARVGRVRYAWRPAEPRAVGSEPVSAARPTLAEEVIIELWETKKKVLPMS